MLLHKKPQRLTFMRARARTSFFTTPLSRVCSNRLPCFSSKQRRHRDPSHNDMIVWPGGGAIVETTWAAGACAIRGSGTPPATASALGLTVTYGPRAAWPREAITRDCSRRLDGKMNPGSTHPPLKPCPPDERARTRRHHNIDAREPHGRSAHNTSSTAVALTTSAKRILPRRCECSNTTCTIPQTQSRRP